MSSSSQVNLFFSLLTSCIVDLEDCGEGLNALLLQTDEESQPLLLLELGAVSIIIPRLYLHHVHSNTVLKSNLEVLVY